MSSDTLSLLRAGKLTGATRLDLSCGLKEIPREVFDLADTLEVLNLTGNELSSLPDDLPKLKKLRILFCSQNAFTHVPAVLGRCESLSMIGFKSNRITSVDAASFPAALRWLILTDNEISELPSSIGACDRLQKLMLSGNRLRSLPDTLSRCTNLELLRLAANEFEELPTWLFDLPRLCWLAFAGNPISNAAQPSQATIRGIAWSEVKLLEKLGEGASGLIHRAEWTPSDRGASRHVAVKLFKGAMTSDGLPGSEMTASIAAGPHPNMTEILGRITGHPAAADGLVMSLIGPEFQILAGPPSFESCTRDIYDPGVSFSSPVALSIARGVAAAAAELHSKGITHGDLYAHNIMWNAHGHSLLGDFGGASFYSIEDKATARHLESIEVRAFSHLLTELRDRTADNELSPLGDALALCQSAHPPCFADLTELLGS